MISAPARGHDDRHPVPGAPAGARPSDCRLSSSGDSEAPGRLGATRTGHPETQSPAGERGSDGPSIETPNGSMHTAPASAVAAARRGRAAVTVGGGGGGGESAAAADSDSEETRRRRTRRA
jgi:hypothetical protein